MKFSVLLFFILLGTYSVHAVMTLPECRDACEEGAKTARKHCGEKYPQRTLECMEAAQAGQDTCKEECRKNNVVKERK